MKEFLTVSDMSKMFGINKQTLHYYDRIGLFRPRYRDNETRYRTYGFDQIYLLATIRYLRKMEYSIDDIKYYLNGRETHDTIDMLKKQSEILHTRWEELMRIDEAIQRKINYVESEKAKYDANSFRIEQLPERRFVQLGSLEDLWLDDSFYFYPTICIYEDSIKYFGAYLMDDNLTPEMKKGTLEHVPAGRYAVAYHTGPYETIQDTFEAIREHYPELEFYEYAATFNIIDQFVETDTGKYVTEIQMRIKE
ncbi:MAG: MerR family transcriptional regulator [Eubacterium sp.]|nr:MerR family transcriptional regulator [Eubacterium sp.]